MNDNPKKITIFGSLLPQFHRYRLAEWLSSAIPLEKMPPETYGWEYWEGSAPDLVKEARSLVQLLQECGSAKMDPHDLFLSFAHYEKEGEEDIMANLVLPLSWGKPMSMLQIHRKIEANGQTLYEALMPIYHEEKDLIIGFKRWISTPERKSFVNYMRKPFTRKELTGDPREESKEALAAVPEDFATFYCRVLHYLADQDYTSIVRLQRALSVSFPLAQQAFKRLQEENIVALFPDNESPEKGYPVKRAKIKKENWA